MFSWKSCLTRQAIGSHFLVKVKLINKLNIIAFFLKEISVSTSIFVNFVRRNLKFGSSWTLLTWTCLFWIAHYFELKTISIGFALPSFTINNSKLFFAPLSIRRNRTDDDFKLLLFWTIFSFLWELEIVGFKRMYKFLYYSKISKIGCPRDRCPTC